MRLRLSLFLVLLFSGWPAAADWIVFLGGGIQEIRGPWEVRGTQLRYHSPTGTLLSVRADEVDLPASAFLSWQVGERRHPPSVTPRGAASGEESGCAPARILRVLGPETLELAIDGCAETIHLECLDAPDTRHRFLSWRGSGCRRRAPSKASCARTRPSAGVKRRLRRATRKGIAACSCGFTTAATSARRWSAAGWRWPCGTPVHAARATGRWRARRESRSAATGARAATTSRSPSSPNPPPSKAAPRWPGCGREAGDGSDFRGPGGLALPS